MTCIRHQGVAFNMSANLRDPEVTTGLVKAILIQFPRQVVLKHVLTIRQLHSPLMLVRSCLKSCMLVFSNMQTKNFQISKLGLEKVRGTRGQIANICWIIEKARELQKNIYFYFIDYSKAFDWVDHNKLWKALKEMGILGHLTCLLRNLNADQEATVRTLVRD